MDNPKYSSALKYIFVLSAIMVLFSLLIAVSYYMTVRNIEINQQKLNLRSLIQTKNIVEERLNKIEYIANSVNTHYKTSYVLNVFERTTLDHSYILNNPDIIITIREYIDYLANLQFSTNLLNEIFVFSPNGHYVFSSKGIIDVDQWYDTSFLSSNLLKDMRMQNMIYLDTQEFFPEYTYSYIGTPVSVIPFFQTHPLGSRKNVLGYILVFINKHALLAWASEEHNYIYIVKAKP